MMNRIALTVLILTLLILSCDRTRTSTGWDYMPDMYYSEAYETYTVNENFRNGMTMQAPVEGTVPRGMVPFAYEKNDEDRLRAGKELANPFLPSEEIIHQGKERYDIFCKVCHGEQGDGQGYLYTSQRYPYPPASLVNEKVRSLPDGEIYHVISVGYGVMGAHASMVPPDDRWKIITYIRQELQK